MDFRKTLSAPRPDSPLWTSPIGIGANIVKAEFFGSTVATVTGYIKVFLSGSWVLKPVKFWNGASWVIKPLKCWGGSNWMIT